MYIYVALLYALVVGFNDIFKKKACQKSNPIAILVIYTTVAFLLSLSIIPFGVAVPFDFFLLLTLKGFIITFDWFIILTMLKKVNISLVMALKLVSILLTFVLGVTVFEETASTVQFVGIFLVIFGITAISLINKKEDNKVKIIHIILLLIASLITTASEVLDKYTTTYLTNFQVQFWYLLSASFFSWIFFFIYCIVSQKILLQKTDIKNYWSYIVGLLLFVSNLLLFGAYRMPGSEMIIITVLSKLKVLITVFAGILIFKEKNIWLKILLTAIIILGTILIALF